MTIHEVAYPIFKRFDVVNFIETGIYTGGTCNVIVGWFALLESQWNLTHDIHYQQVPCRHQIWEVDINPKSCKIVQDKHGGPNVHVACCDSAEFIQQGIECSMWEDGQSFFYLDAHSAGKRWPLRDEITQILRLPNKPIIMIDDYKECEGLSPRGHDGYPEGVCGTGYIKDLLKDRCCGVFHTSKPNINDRGIGIIFVDRDIDSESASLLGLVLEQI